VTRFADNGSTLTDNLTGLMWSKDGNAPGPPTCNPAATKTWLSAIDYTTCLNTNSYLGYSDWRLPNRKELGSLMNFGQSSFADWLNTQGFNNVQPDYWTATTYAADVSQAWFAQMSPGGGLISNALASAKTYTHHVCPVRSVVGYTPPVSLAKTGQITSYAAGDDGDIQSGLTWPNPRFTNPDGTSPVTGAVVLDQLTSLTWIKDGNTPGPTACVPASTKTWQAALDFVACLNANNYLGYTDWRLPNVNELESLVNAGQAVPATWLNTQGFSNVQSLPYWSSTTMVGNETAAWMVGMDFGEVAGGFFKTNGETYVWPVRAGQ
jgi:hypothetical protein